MPSDLTSLEDWAIAQLIRAAADRKSPLHWPVLTTYSKTSGPAGRVVVLRRFDVETRTASLYTDKRSQKVADLTDDPRAELIFFDARNLLQIRLSGPAEIIRSGPARQEALAKLSPRELNDYSTVMGPGTEAVGADVDRNLTLAEINFTLVYVRADLLDILSLSRHGHKRAKLTWEGDVYSANWITP